MSRCFQIVRRGEAVPLGSVAAEIIQRLERAAVENQRGNDAGEQSKSDAPSSHLPSPPRVTVRHINPSARAVTHPVMLTESG